MKKSRLAVVMASLALGSFAAGISPVSAVTGPGFIQSLPRDAGGGANAGAQPPRGDRNRVATPAPRVIRPANTALPRNHYFENRTRGTSVTNSSIGTWRIVPPVPTVAAPVYEAADRAPRPALAPVNERSGRAIAGTAAGPALSQQAPAATFERRTATHRIDPSAPHAGRDSSGIRFGPGPLPRTAPLIAPQVPYSGSIGVDDTSATWSRHGRGVGTAPEFRPPEARLVRHRAGLWYSDGSRWYRADPQRGWREAVPPIGFVSPYLPEQHQVVIDRGITYYVVGNTAFRESGAGFLVVQALPAHGRPSGFGAVTPLSAIAPVAFASVPDFIIEPRSDRTHTQLLRDRDACIADARRESGFDPALIDGGVDTHAVETGQQAFNGAFGACLITLGYHLR